MKAIQISSQEAQKIFEKAFLQLVRQWQAEKRNFEDTILSRRQETLSSPLKKIESSLSHELRKSLHRSSFSDLSYSVECSPIKSNIMTSHKLSIDKEDQLIDGEIMTPFSSFRLPERDSGSELSVIGEGKELLMDDDDKHKQQFSLQNCQEANNHPQKLYLESQMKEVKRILEIDSKGKICKTQEINKSTEQVIGYHLLCKSDPDCPFEYFFEYSGQRNFRGDKYFKLKPKCKNHLSTCIEPEEEINFMKLTQIIDQLENDIATLLSQDSTIKPKEILEMIAKNKGEEDCRFIYRGLYSKSYLKAAKKYFDNLIYKVRSQICVI